MAKSSSGTKSVIIIFGIVLLLSLGTLVVFKRISANRGKPLPVPEGAAEQPATKPNG